MHLEKKKLTASKTDKETGEHVCPVWCPGTSQMVLHGVECRYQKAQVGISPVVRN